MLIAIMMIIILMLQPLTWTIVHPFHTEIGNTLHHGTFTVTSYIGLNMTVFKSETVCMMDEIDTSGLQNIK
jgi:hypothetical protein